MIEDIRLFIKGESVYFIVLCSPSLLCTAIVYYMALTIVRIIE